MSKPLSISASCDFIGQYLPSYLLISRPNNVRRMRKERQESTQRVLLCLLQHMDCRSQRVVRPCAGGRFALLTVEYIARCTELCTKTVWRVMRDLVDVGYLKVSPQPKAIKVATVSLFVGVARSLTRKFFEHLGLLDVLEKDMAFANSKPPIEIVRPVKKKLLTYLTNTMENQLATFKALYDIPDEEGRK